MNTLKVTLTGMHHYNEARFIEHYNYQVRLGRSVPLWLRKDEKHKHRIEVYAFEDGIFFQVGSLSANDFFCKRGYNKCKNDIRIFY